MRKIVGNIEPIEQPYGVFGTGYIGNEGKKRGFVGHMNILLHRVLCNRMTKFYNRCMNLNNAARKPQPPL